MREVVLLLSLFICLSGYSQIPDPEYFLNSTVIDLRKVFLNPMRIDSIHIDNKTTTGSVYISTKDKRFTFLTLDQIIKNQTTLCSLNDSVLIKINGNIITDTAGIKIDDSFYIYAGEESVKDVLYLNSRLRGLIIINICLEKEARKPIIHIRGNNDLLNKLEEK
jgi:hypothetical protein